MTQSGGYAGLRMRVGMSGQAAMQRESVPRIRVVVADDHPVMRVGLVSVLEQDPLLEVVGEARNGREAVLLVQTLEPHVVLMDLAMPEMDGLEATRAVRECCPNTSVLILTLQDDDGLLRAAVNAGAAGYLLKTVTGEQLCAAVRDAAMGIFPMDRHMLADMFPAYDENSAGQPTHAVSGSHGLTPRECEVLTLVARGLSNREIAETLVVTTFTVKAHVDHILAKLDVTSRTEAAVRGVELGYVSRTD